MVIGDRNNVIIPSVDSLFDDFNHPNPNINDNAVADMVLYYPEESINRLIKYLYVEDLNLRRKSVKAIAKFGIKIINIITELFFSTEELTLRISCLKIFVKIAAKNQSEQFVKAINNVIRVCMDDNNPLVILTFISLLRQLNKKGIPYLIILAKDENVLKAKAAITAMSEINDEKVCKCLQLILKDESKDQLIIDSAKEALAL